MTRRRFIQLMTRTNLRYPTFLTTPHGLFSGLRLDRILFLVPVDQETQYHLLDLDLSQHESIAASEITLALKQSLETPNPQDF